MFYDGECATLRCFNLTKADKGIFVCTAENEMGKATTQTKVQLNSPSTESKQALKPKFAENKQKYQKIVDATPLILRAVLQRECEDVSFMWMYNQIRINDSKAFIQTNTSTEATLTIVDPFPEDSGVYTCIAENNFGVDNLNVEVVVVDEPKSPTVLVKPSVIPTVTKISEFLGTTAKISCEVMSSPDAVIKWFKSNNQLLPNSKYEISYDKSICMLTINNLEGSDAGVYKLVAVNNAGSSEEKFFVDVNSQLK